MQQSTAVKATVRRSEVYSAQFNASMNRSIVYRVPQSRLQGTAVKVTGHNFMLQCTAVLFTGHRSNVYSMKSGYRKSKCKQYIGTAASFTVGSKIGVLRRLRYRDLGVVETAGGSPRHFSYCSRDCGSHQGC